MEVENTDYRYEVIDLKNPYDIKKVCAFLESLGLDYSKESVDYTMILINLNGDLIGTGSLSNNVLKYVAIAPKYRDTTAFALVVTHLTETSLANNNKTAFVYTRPENIEKFTGIGFRLVAQAPPIYALLEFGYKTIIDYKLYLKTKRIEINSNQIAAVVLNANPFTNGHKYLIERASSENEILYIFVVEEDKSVFPFDVRWKLIEEGTSHLKNRIMISGGKYIVSTATFPAYFLKNESINSIVQKQTELDVNIFGTHIAPELNIKKRYVGTEVYCKTTAAYNVAMKKLLQNYDIELHEIERKWIGEKTNFISASKVRTAIKNNTILNISEYLHESTIKFLLSDESLPIKNKIIQYDLKH